MKLYDELIVNVKKQTASHPVRDLVPGKTAWAQVSDRSMILRSDMAYELGGEQQPSVGCTLITTSDELVAQDGIHLIGSDLPEITTTGNVPYARIALVRIQEDESQTGEVLYNAIRKLENTRYHFYPEGFMMRVSASKNKESVRISREALGKGLDFAKAGNLMIEAFHKNPSVEAVEIYYVTANDFDYKSIEKVTEESDGITKTIDHIFKNVIMDCNACNLQEICDEVEGLKELHFAQQKAAGN